MEPWLEAVLVQQGTINRLASRYLSVLVESEAPSVLVVPASMSFASYLRETMIPGLTEWAGERLFLVFSQESAKDLLSILPGTPPALEVDLHAARRALGANPPAGSLWLLCLEGSGERVERVRVSLVPMTQVPVEEGEVDFACVMPKETGPDPYSPRALFDALQEQVLSLCLHPQCVPGGQSVVVVASERSPLSVAVRMGLRAERARGLYDTSFWVDGVGGAVLLHREMPVLTEAMGLLNEPGQGLLRELLDVPQTTVPVLLSSDRELLQARVTPRMVSGVLGGSLVPGQA